jgi:hypothetical protein
MANKTKRAIEDSKRKRDFKQRSKGRKDRTQKKDKFEKNRYIQRGSEQHMQASKRMRKDDDGENEDDKYKRVMEEDDPELERELKEAGLIDGDVGEDGSENLDENEFLEHADELDLPSEDEADNEDDLKGEETDSDLEDYYRELGIENEEDEVAPAKAVKKQPKKDKKPSKLAASLPQVATKEELRRRILDQLMEKTRSAPTYSNISRVIKIVKQVFFAGNQQSGSGEGEEEEEGKKQAKKDKSQAIATILLSNAGEYKRLLEFFSQEIPKLILKLCSIAEKTPKEGQ